MLLGLLLVHVERVHELGGEDLLGPGVHLLLPGGEALLTLADGQVADHLAELVDVAGLDLVAVVLVAPVPVLRHLRSAGTQHGQDLLDRLLVDHAAKAGDRGVLRRDHDRHVVVVDLDRQVDALLTEHLTRFLLDHLPRAVVRIDDVVALLELDVLEDRGLDLGLLLNVFLCR